MVIIAGNGIIIQSTCVAVKRRNDVIRLKDRNGDEYGITIKYNNHIKGDDYRSDYHKMIDVQSPIVVQVYCLNRFAEVSFRRIAKPEKASEDLEDAKLEEELADILSSDVGLAADDSLKKSAPAELPEVNASAEAGECLRVEGSVGDTISVSSAGSSSKKENKWNTLHCEYPEDFLGTIRSSNFKIGDGKDGIQLLLKLEAGSKMDQVVLLITVAKKKDRKKFIYYLGVKEETIDFSRQQTSNSLLLYRDGTLSCTLPSVVTKKAGDMATQLQDQFSSLMSSVLAAIKKLEISATL